jgi:hypothetical protein
MKIARPARPEVAFKRKRSPPPQATKLIRYSFVAGVVFIVLLAIVFVPRMFPNQSPVEIVNPANGGKLRYDTSNGTRLYVDSVTVALELGRFRANLSSGSTTLASLPAGLTGGNATLRFVDANGNGLLDSGDYFAVSPPANGCHRFSVFQVDVGRVAGYLDWGVGCGATFNSSRPIGAPAGL